ncbi:endonuclease/exonuclease/phosphatase family protein [Pengzhenrongella sicca]|uniref:Endonuclease/exonuclease/phosphatase family protein n=1 Tax=Pengzhenrongella sicca TaxID=2819238 RepID=A0A8A4ZBN6_9MICO|nr:endonuclease/exonuclease/phosphatase family protein [Pengzhenrongella sicca]QTE28419.1 endonuclease/exonuclease/phosphatase family protein [Pengzhenrongella sicca]
MTPPGRPRRDRRRVVRQVVRAAGLGVGIGAGVLLAFGRPTGLTGAAGFAQAISFRAVLAFALAAAAALAAALPGRRRRVGLVAVLALAALLQAVVLADRGLVPAGVAAGPAPRDGLVVLAANTESGASAADLADLVRATGANVAVLPETTRAVADDVAARLAASGTPMQVLSRQSSDHVASATALLVAATLGTYAIDGVADTALASFTAVPVDGSGPTLVAVHATPPAARAAMDPWRRSTAWATAVCRDTRDVVVAGDFNATLDHPAFAALAPCVDAAEAAGAAGLGTWPSSAPRLLATPIDHVLVDGRRWRVLSFAVLDAVPRSDHRPVVARLARR